jgi:hypothetical protein
LLAPFESSDVVQRIFEYAMTNEEAHVSAGAFELLGELTDQCNDCDDADGDPLCETVVRFLTGKIGEICQFVRSGKPFLASKASAVALICGLVKGTVPEPVISLAASLVGKMFANPTNSFLHRALQSLFDEIARDGEKLGRFCAESKIRTRIVEAFARRDAAYAAYWGALYSFAQAIGEKEEDDQEWKVFLATTIADIRNVISQPFGGPKPGEGGEQPGQHVPFPVGKSHLQKGVPEAAMTVAPDNDEEDGRTEQC